MHPATKRQYDQVVSSLPHAVLILGEVGAGKAFLAKNLAGKVLKTDRVESHPYFKAIYSEESGGIDAVREIKHFLSLKTTGQNVFRRVMLIEKADKLGHEAQNALLKILEEPPLDTMLVLTASDKTKLLQTVISRLQILNVMPLGKEQALKAADGSRKSDIEALYLMSGGQAGLFMSLINGNKEHPLIQAVTDAKTIISSTVYERLVKITDLSKEKDKLDYLLDGMQRVLSASFNQAAKQDNQNLAKRLAKARKLVLEAQESLTANANTKLVLTNLFLNL